MSIAEQPRLLNQLIESLGQASGAASQILHMHQDPRWMMIRDALDLAKEGTMSIATTAVKQITAVRPQ